MCWVRLVIQIMSGEIEFNPKAPGLLIDIFRGRKHLAVARSDFVKLLMQSDTLLAVHLVNTCPGDWQDLQAHFHWHNDVMHYVSSRIYNYSQRITPERTVPYVDDKGVLHRVLSYQTLVQTAAVWELVFPQDLIEVCGYLIRHRRHANGEDTTAQFDAEASSSACYTKNILGCMNANRESKALSVVMLQASYADLSKQVRHICLKCVGKYITCCTCHTYVNAYRHVIINSWRFYQ
jgi:hypothetical protein